MSLSTQHTDVDAPTDDESDETDDDIVAEKLARLERSRERAEADPRIVTPGNDPYDDECGIQTSERVKRQAIRDIYDGVNGGLR